MYGLGVCLYECANNVFFIYGISEAPERRQGAETGTAGR